MAVKRDTTQAPPRTPDGRYMVVNGVLWRATNPNVSGTDRDRLIHALMDARRAVGTAKRAGDAGGEAAARAGVQAAKLALGERGPPWWGDGAPDYNRHRVERTPYAQWWAARG